MSEKKKLGLPLAIDKGQSLTLPKIHIKNILSALRNEEGDELLAFYALFIDRDLHLSGELLKRRMQILSAPYLIECEDESQKLFLENYLEAIDLHDLLFDLSAAIPYGFACIDLIYAPLEIEKKSYFAPMKFRYLRPRYFRFDSKSQGYLLQISQTEQLDPLETPEKFILHLHKSDSGEVADYALMKKVLFTCALKHSVLSANMQLFENLGVPPVIIQYDTDDEDLMREILKQVNALRGNSMALFPQEAVVKLLEGKGSKGEFLGFIEYCDRSISHFVLGNTLSGSESKGGSYALGKVHDGRRKDFLTFDCRLLEKSVKRLLERVLSLNFSNHAPFKFKLDTSDETDEKLLSEVYKNLTEAGYEIPLEHIERAFSLQGVKFRGEGKGEDKEEEKPKAKASKPKPTPKEEEELEEEAESTTKKSTKAEKNARGFNPAKTPRHIDYIDEGSEASAKDIKLEEYLAGLLEECGSFEEAYDRLLEERGDGEIEELEELLASALQNAQILPYFKGR